MDRLKRGNVDLSDVDAPNFEARATSSTRRWGSNAHAAPSTSHSPVGVSHPGPENGPCTSHPYLDGRGGRSRRSVSSYAAPFTGRLRQADSGGGSGDRGKPDLLHQAHDIHGDPALRHLPVTEVVEVQASTLTRRNP
jgi:hypothetical protein